MNVRIFSLLFLAILATGPAVAVPLYGTEEIVLRSSVSYDGIAGTPNPFDLGLTARVTAPSGRRFTVDGFFDGDGEGGSSGRVFKVRISAEEPGVWRWETASDVPGLNGLSGRFTVEGRLGGVFGQGPVGVSPGRPLAFARREGRPVFLVGKFLDQAAPSPLKYSHTMFSEELGENDREALLARHVDLGLNKINVYLANRGDYGGVSTTPWVGTAEANDKRRLDLSRFRMYERWVVRMRDAGMVAHLWFFADDSGFGDLPDGDRKPLIRYAMARLSGYSNTMFTLALEWQEGWSPAEVESHARFLQEKNPWGRLASVHGTTGPFAFPNAPWADFLDVQAGNDARPEGVYALGLAQRGLAAKPLLQEEHGLGDEDAANRRRAWAAFLSGAAGVGTGAFLEHLARFAETVRFERLEPASRLVLAGEAWALAEKQRTFVFYLPEGGTVRVNLRGAPGPLKVRWYDPRTGAFREAPPIPGGKVRAFTAPSDDDWALYINK